MSTDFKRIRNTEAIRRGLHIPQVYISKAMGWHPTSWSNAVNRDKLLSDKEQVRVHNILKSLILLKDGEELGSSLSKSKDKVGTGISNLLEGLQVLEKIVESGIESTIVRRAASTYIKAMREEIQGL